METQRTIIRAERKESLMRSSIAILDHANDVQAVVLEKINSVFSESDQSYFHQSVEVHRSLMLAAQKALVDIDAHRQISDSIQPELEKYLDTSDWLIQSNLYLRAARPHNSVEGENIGWHREPFYGPALEKSVNVWTPIRGVNSDNTLRYIPESQKIPCSDIETKNIGSEFTQRFSAGHKLGFNYDQKWITGGVDLNDSKRLVVECGRSAVFSGMLIHGAATNKSEVIRFSVDFQIMRKSDYRTLNKKFHFGSGKPYFVEF